MDIKEHYDKHLSNYYSWIYGGFDTKVEENLTFFKKHGIKPLSTKIAIDLGCGSGFQSIPLAQIGFEVKSIDISENLLKELSTKKGVLNIEIIEGDILNYKLYNNFKPELIVCMGDTLTHLSDLDKVKELVNNCNKILSDRGKLILSFRDFTFELKEEKRFIPVRSDEKKIFTCFLEYTNGIVNVYNLVYELENGNWVQKISFYKKIKISSDFIKEVLIGSGFNIDVFELNKGFITIISSKNK